MKKTVFLLLLSALLWGCKSDRQKARDFETEKISLNPTTLASCQEANCPEVRVDYLKIKGDSDFSQSINTKNQADLISLFDLNQEDSIAAKTVEAAVNNFVEEYFQFKNQFPDAVAAYETEVSQEIKDRNAHTVVLKTSFYIYTGGAHGYGGIHFLNFDAQTGAYLRPEEVITNLAAFTDFAEKKFRQQYQIPEDADINSKGFFFEDGQFALPQNIAFMENQVILLYNPYEAASYAAGELRFVFPKSQVGQWLKY